MTIELAQCMHLLDVSTSGSIQRRQKVRLLFEGYQFIEDTTQNTIDIKCETLQLDAIVEAL